MLAGVVCVAGVILGVIAVVSWRMACGRGGDGKQDGGKQDDGPVRFRIVAHNVKSRNPNGWYTIESTVGGYWVTTEEFLSTNRWNPLLLPYEQAKARAQEWKDAPEKFEAFKLEQREKAKAHQAADQAQRAKLFPVMKEEI